MALTKTQRGAIEEVVRTLEKGPGSGWDEPGSPITPRDPETMRAVKLWAQTWLQGPLAGVLANDAGEISSAALARYY